MTLAIHEVSPITTDARHVVADIHERTASMAYAHIFTDPFPRDETKQRWDDYTGRIALACDEDRPVAFIAWHHDEIDALYVLPEAAGHGLGSQLMALATDASRLWVLEGAELLRAPGMGPFRECPSAVRGGP